MRKYADRLKAVDTPVKMTYYHIMRKKNDADAAAAAATIMPQTPEQVFKALVQRCIDSYTLFGDDSLSLDYNRVTDTKLRSMILQDYEYRQETKFIRAKKIMDDIQEMTELGRLAAGMSELMPEADAEEDAEEEYDVRGTQKPAKQKPKQKKSVTADKDMLNMRFKAAQERRALLNDINKIDGDELDAVNFFFVPVSREEFERLGTVEISEETALDDAGTLRELAGALAEKLPESVSARHDDLPEKQPEFVLDEDGMVIEVRT